MSTDISKDYINFLKTGELSDTEILVGKEPNTKTFHLHSLILRIRSSYFRTAFSSDWIKIENGITKFQKPNISVEVFDVIVKYIYGGRIDLSNDVKTNIELLIAADELCLDDLCSYIERYLLEDEGLLKSNFILISHVVNQFRHFTKLSQFYKDSYQKDSSLIFEANDFVTIKQEILLDILTKNDHTLKPIEAWDKLFEWAIAQSNELPSDVTKWTADDVLTFGGLVKQFIPHINYNEILPSDFFQKIIPFKNIFDDKLYIKILEDYSFNGFTIDSKIINYDQFCFLRDKINSVHFNYADDGLSVLVHKFKLLARGSRDGFDHKSFRVDWLSLDTIIAKIKNTNKIIGAFNNNEKKIYIFSLNRNNLENSIFNKEYKHEVSDIRLFISECFKNIYEERESEGEDEFEIEECEVFRSSLKITF